MIVNFIVEYALYVSEYLARELRDPLVAVQNELLAYPYMISQICLAVKVFRIPYIYEMIEAQRTFDIGLIRDAAKPLAQPMR